MLAPQCWSCKCNKEWKLAAYKGNLWFNSEGRMTFYGPLSQYTGLKARTLCFRYPTLFAFDSDMIIASLPGFKVIFYLSSEPKMFYWRSKPAVESYECDNDILQQWEDRFCSLLNSLHSAKQDGLWNGMSLLQSRRCMGPTDENMLENKMHLLCLKWQRSGAFVNVFLMHVCFVSLLLKHSCHAKPMRTKGFHVTLKNLAQLFSFFFLTILTHWFKTSIIPKLSTCEHVNIEHLNQNKRKALCYSASSSSAKRLHDKCVISLSRFF